MGLFETVTLVCGAITAAAGVITLIIKGVIKVVKRVRARRQGELAVLRAHMLSIYYANRDSQTIRQYELENFLEFYDSYTGQGGNSFMVEIHDIVVTWKVVT